MTIIIRPGKAKASTTGGTGVHRVNRFGISDLLRDATAPAVRIRYSGSVFFLWRRKAFDCEGR
jgi:hypothetical protein